MPSPYFPDSHENEDLYENPMPCSSNARAISPDLLESSIGQPSSQPVNLAKRPKASLDKFVVRTSSDQGEKINKQIAKYIFATNTPFRHVEHEEFKKMIELLRPGYKPPSRRDIGNKLLDEVFEEEQEHCKSVLAGKIVCLSMDGWSNIRNEPIICCSVTTRDGQIVLVDTIDTSGKSHTAEYLETLAKDCVTKTEEKFRCIIGSLVTDNAANMAKMRQLLSQDDYYKYIITFGCSAHILNLLAKDLEIKDVTEHVIQIIKYFRNNHMARAKYKQANGSALKMPIEVRWSTMCQALESYVSNWVILFEISESFDEIDQAIKSKIQNTGIKRNAEDLISRLRPIANALNDIQSDTCGLTDAVIIWKKLLSIFEEGTHNSNFALSILQKVVNRYKQAITQAHFLAVMLSPKLEKNILSPEERKSVFDYVSNNFNNTNLMQILIKLNSKTEPFSGSLMSDKALEANTIDWWETIYSINGITEDDLKLIKKFLTAVPSSAGVERIFSTYNLCHNDLRNRLGNEKAAKLVFVMKSLNMKILS